MVTVAPPFVTTYPIGFHKIEANISLHNVKSIVLQNQSLEKFVTIDCEYSSSIYYDLYTWVNSIRVNWNPLKRSRTV